MNKLLAVSALACALFTGCQSIPTVSQMETTAYSIGLAAGYVANETKIDDASRNAVVEIISEVSKCMPETNQTFTAAWTPIATEYADKLVADGKITDGQKVLILSAFNVACSGIDYLFDVRYPKAREYSDLVAAAVKGFSNGFLTVFKPTNALEATKDAPDMDKEAYEALKAKFAN